MKKILLIVFAAALLFSSCANEKTLTLNGQTKTFEPYGWADCQDIKNDSVKYKLNVGNVVWDVLLFETIIVPICLTGYQAYEPVCVKPEFVKIPCNNFPTVTITE
jgi:hypothetical protein